MNLPSIKHQTRIAGELLAKTTSSCCYTVQVECNPPLQQIIDNRHPYLDWKHMYSAHTKLLFYPRFAPEVFKHSFSFKDSVLLFGYSSVALTSKYSRLFLGWRLAYYWYRRFPYKKYLNMFVKMAG